MTPSEKHELYRSRARSCDTIDWLDGHNQCFSCHKNVYEYVDDYTVKKGMITGCPVCHRSFVD